MIQDKFEQYPYRFAIVILFCLVSFLNGMTWVIVTPIEVQIAKAYNVREDLVTLIPLSYMVMYIIVNIPSNWVLDQWGIRKGIIIGALLTACGCAIGCFVNYWFGCVIIGQILCGIAQPFITNAPSKIAIRWFTEKNRSIALAILAVINIIGSAVGFLVSSAFVQDSEQYQRIRIQFFYLNLCYTIIGIVTALLIILLFSEKPPTMPSKSAQTVVTPFLQTIKILYTSPRFLALTAAFATVLGTFNVFGSVMQFVLAPYNYSSNDVSVFVTVLIVSGVISAGIFGFYIQKTLNYSKVFKICGILGICSIILLILMMKLFSNVYWLVVFIFFIMGIVMVPLVPLSIQYGCQIMFPVGEAQITGTLMASGQIFGIIFIVIPEQCFSLGKGNKQAGYITVVIDGTFMIIGCLAYCCFNFQLKRSGIDRPVQGTVQALELGS